MALRRRQSKSGRSAVKFYEFTGKKDGAEVGAVAALCKITTHEYITGPVALPPLIPHG